MLVDIHTHIFPPEIIRDRERFFPCEPEFRLLYDSPKAKLSSAEALIAEMDEAGVDRAVTFGFPWRNPKLHVLHNDYVLNAAAKVSSRLIAFGCTSLYGREALREAERCFRGGARGLGELALYSGENLDRAAENFSDVAQICRERRGILLVHANEPVGHVYPGKASAGLDYYYSLAKLAAGVPLVFGHWGGGLCFFELLKKEAPEVLANVYYDSAASPFLYRPEIYPVAARAAGAGKILFGSDWPLISQKRCLKEMKDSGLSEAEFLAIAGENAARLLGISPTG